MNGLYAALKLPEFLKTGDGKANLSSTLLFIPIRNACFSECEDWPIIVLGPHLQALNFLSFTLRKDEENVGPKNI